ncbi:MAG TPA: hypothetical protein PLL64_10565 [Rhodothermales bacterium]|nr:hypothetical protein [Bacteroidota bacterium]HRK74709.1 hypothetical protein [Rhodothermales bacterium]HRR08683.1 hypothetical protein [Rhodothermales bacterium]
MLFWKKTPPPSPSPVYALPEFAPSLLRFDEFIFTFHEPLLCEVKFDAEKGYEISFPPLLITGRGESFSEAEMAFSMQFYSAYHKYIISQPKALSEAGKHFTEAIRQYLRHVFVEMRTA